MGSSGIAQIQVIFLVNAVAKRLWAIYLVAAFIHTGRDSRDTGNNKCCGKR